MMSTGSSDDDGDEISITEEMKRTTMTDWEIQAHYLGVDGLREGD
jgi:hypothetical protein